LRISIIPNRRKKSWRIYDASTTAATKAARYRVTATMPGATGGIYDPQGVERIGGKMTRKLSSLKPRVTTLDTRVGSVPATKRIRGWKLTKARERIARRDDYTCQICGRVTALDRGELDHIVPLSRGGSNADVNLQWLCVACNQAKSDKEEEKART